MNVQLVLKRLPPEAAPTAARGMAKHVSYTHAQPIRNDGLAQEGEFKMETTANAPDTANAPAVTTQPAVTKHRDEATIKRQILTNAKKYLAELANQRVTDTKPYEAPTREEIAAECKKRWQQHLDRAKVKVDPSEYFN